MTQPKGPRLLHTLKLFGLLAAFLLLYPLCYLAWFLRGEASVPLSLLGELAVIACGFCGAGLRTLLERRKQHLPAGNVLLLLTGILLSLAAFFLFGAGLLPGLPLAVSCLAAFVTGDRMTLLPYDAVATRAFFTVALVGYLGCGAAVWALQSLRGFSGSYLPLAVLLFCTLGIHELSCNQAQIDFLMQRRGHRMDQLPSKIRRYNLTLVLAVLAIILLCLLFYRPLGTAIAFVLDLVRQLAVLILQGILYLASLFSPSEEISSGEEMQEPSDFLPPQSEEPAGPDWVTPLLLLAAVALLIWKHRVIGNAIRQVLLALIQRLRSLFAIRRRAPHSEEETGYFDTVEELTHDRESLRLFSPSPVRSWRRDLRALRRMPDGTEKLRNGYALLARGLQLAGVELLPSDTPEELLHHACEASPGLEAERAVAAYEQARYNEEEAAPASLSEMLSLLERLSKRF